MSQAIDLSALTVQPDSYLTLHYRLSDDAGNEHVSTFELSPATLQMGNGQLAEPLERCLIGMAPGQRHVFSLKASEAFGERQAQRIEHIARSALPPEIELKENSLIKFGTSTGNTGFAGFLRELTATTATLDFNHPLAGKAIRFEVEIIGIM